MATTIGKLVVLLSGNVNGFVSSFGKARKAMSSFAAQSASVASGMVISRVVEAGAAALVNFAKKGFESIDSVAKLSDRLGIATEKLVGLQYAADLAGVSNEELTGGLEKLLKTLGAIGGGGAAGASAVAAFEAVGLSMADLSGKSPDQIFAMIGDGLAGISEPGNRATAAINIFGKSAQGLLPLLFEGVAGMDALQKRAEELGLSFTRVDAAQVEAANDALSTAGKIFEGIGQKIAVELSPFITAAADAMTAFATSGSGSGEVVTNAVEWIATTVAKLSDWVSGLNSLWLSFKAIVVGAAAGALIAIDLLGKGVVALLNLLPGVNIEWTDTFSVMAEDMKKQADELADAATEAQDKFLSGANSAAVGTFFDDLRKKSAEAAKAAAEAKPKNNPFEAMDVGAEEAADAIDKLRTKVEQFSMSEKERAVAELIASGATAEQTEEAKKLLSTLDELEAAKDRQKELDNLAAQVMEDNILPFEKYQQQLDQLSDLLLMGKIDWETYQRAVTKAKDELDRPADLGELDSPKLLEAGSAATADLLANIEAKTTGDKQKNDQKILRQAETQTETQRAILSRIISIGVPSIATF